MKRSAAGNCATGGRSVKESYEEIDYIWGPGYVDELAIFDQQERLHPLRPADANYNVMAYAKPTGRWSGSMPTVRTATWRRQTGAPKSRSATKDCSSSGSTGDVGDAPLDADAKGLYYNRNRWLSPKYGRFTSRDVNETAMPIVTAMLYNAESWSILLSGFSGQGLYGDGMNLYEYQGSNPLKYLDGLGLDYDPFEEVAKILGEMWAERAAAAASGRCRSSRRSPRLRCVRCGGDDRLDAAGGGHLYRRGVACRRGRYRHVEQRAKLGQRAAGRPGFDPVPREGGEVRPLRDSRRSAGPWGG